jgi:TRAP-type C4-dicarboxylate transport system permease small subunit
MNSPNGLRSPTAILQLIPVLLAFAAVCWFTYGFITGISQPAPNLDVPAPQASDVPGSLFGLEAVFGVATALVLLALVWGMVRYVTRNRSKDALTEAATRELYRQDASGDLRQV